MTERSKAITRNPEVLSWSPLSASHAGVNTSCKASQVGILIMTLKVPSWYFILGILSLEATQQSTAYL